MDSHSGSIVSFSTARSVPCLEKGEEGGREEKENMSKGAQAWNSTLEPHFEAGGTRVQGHSIVSSRLVCIS